MLIADLGTAARCGRLPTYRPTRRAIMLMLGNSARAVIVSNQKLAKNLVRTVLTSDDCHHIIGIEGIRAGQVPDWVPSITGPIVHRRSGRRGIARTGKKVGQDDLACIIYTSGTGGAPRRS
jgi:long-chain acyl-CoA synthetase